jgi:N-acetylmuramoyl-L-alanine amidase
MLAPLCVALAIVAAAPHPAPQHRPSQHHPAQRARPNPLVAARAALREVKRDPAKRRYRHQWERAIRALEAAARGKDTAPALLEAARARYALYRFSQVESDRAAALRLASRAGRAGAKEARTFAAAVRREAGEEKRPGVKGASLPRPATAARPPAAAPSRALASGTAVAPKPKPTARGKTTSTATTVAAPGAPAAPTTPPAPTPTTTATPTAAPATSTPAPTPTPTPTPTSNPTATSTTTATTPEIATTSTPATAASDAHPELETLAGTDDPGEPPSADPVLARILAQLEAEQAAPPRPAVPSAAPAAIRRVVLDAGHGGHDTGAIGPTGVREKDVVLAIARRVARKLAEAGFEIVLTRDDDRYLPLDERTAKANARGGDLFVSIHANAHPRRDRHGVETYVLNVANDRYAKRLAARENGALDEGEAPEVRRILADLDAKASAAPSRRLAEAVQRELTAGIRARYGDVRDLGVKSALFYVLLGARMPAVLVETSFLSNRVEERRLASPRFQEEVAAGIARAVRGFAAREARIAAR